MKKSIKEIKSEIKSLRAEVVSINEKLSEAKTLKEKKKDILKIIKELRAEHDLLKD